MYPPRPLMAYTSYKFCTSSALQACVHTMCVWVGVGVWLVPAVSWLDSPYREWCMQYDVIHLGVCAFLHSHVLVLAYSPSCLGFICIPYTHAPIEQRMGSSMSNPIGSTANGLACRPSWNRTTGSAEMFAAASTHTAGTGSKTNPGWAHKDSL